MNQDEQWLEPEIKRHLELLRDTPPREPNTVQAGRRNFLNMAASMKQPVSKTPIEGLNKWIPIFNRKERLSIFTVITTIVVALIMLFSGATATVYASKDSTPEDLLYSVKTWSEDVQLSLTNNPQSKFNLIEEYVLRRFSEADSLIDEEEPIPPGLVTRLENQLQYMLQLAAQMKDEDEALIRVRSILQEREQLMTNQGDNVSEWANPVFAKIRQELNERIRRSETEIDEPLKFQQQMESPAGGYGPGSGTGSGNPEEISPIPPGQGEDKPSGPGPCDLSEEGCSSGEDSEPKTPTDPTMNSGETPTQQQSGDTSKQNDNPGNNDSSGSGSGSGGKP